MLFVMPTWINFVIRTSATRDLLNWIGISTGAYSTITTMIGLVYNYLPFVILPLYTTMLKLDKSQMEAALDLGARPSQVFTKNILQQSRVKVGCFDTEFYGFHDIRTEEDIESMKFNTAIAALMEFVNAVAPDKFITKNNKIKYNNRYNEIFR